MDHGYIAYKSFTSSTQVYGSV